MIERISVERWMSVQPFHHDPKRKCHQHLLLIAEFLQQQQQKNKTFLLSNGTIQTIWAPNSHWIVGLVIFLNLEKTKIIYSSNDQIKFITKSYDLNGKISTNVYDFSGIISVKIKLKCMYWSRFAVHLTN